MNSCLRSDSEDDDDLCPCWISVDVAIHWKQILMTQTFPTAFKSAEAKRLIIDPIAISTKTNGVE